MTEAKTPLQQFIALQRTFTATYSYGNTGENDSHDIVARFFIDAYMMEQAARNKDDIVAVYMIGKEMRRYELQFGTMLGGEKGLKRVGDAAAAILGLAQNAAPHMNVARAVLGEMTLYPN